MTPRASSRPSTRPSPSPSTSPSAMALRLHRLRPPLPQLLPQRLLPFRHLQPQHRLPSRHQSPRTRRRPRQPGSRRIPNRWLGPKALWCGRGLEAPRPSTSSWPVAQSAMQPRSFIKIKHAKAARSSLGARSPCPSCRCWPIRYDQAFTTWLATVRNGLSGSVRAHLAARARRAPGCGT